MNLENNNCMFKFGWVFMPNLKYFLSPQSAYLTNFPLVIIQCFFTSGEWWQGPWRAVNCITEGKKRNLERRYNSPFLVSQYILNYNAHLCWAVPESQIIISNIITLRNAFHVTSVLD
jgi:hypothetical protein